MKILFSMIFPRIGELSDVSFGGIRSPMHDSCPQERSAPSISVNEGIFILDEEDEAENEGA